MKSCVDARRGAQILSRLFAATLFGTTLFAFSPARAAVPETHGTLVADDGFDIYDWELDLLLDLFIGNNYHSRILAFTECYGGDKLDEFAGDPDTTVLSGSTPGNTTDYGGYHRGLAGGLAPGSTTDAAHAAGTTNAKPGDSPTKAGPNQDIGTGGDGGAITSTHVLVWAGDPNWQDQADIDDINNNFGGQPNTTVTTLAGDGTGAGVDGAATFENLVDALADIGTLMNQNEQFILFVTDHGDLDTSLASVNCPPGGCSQQLILTPQLHAQMLDDIANTPNLTLVTAQPQPIPPGSLQVSFNGQGPFDIGQFLRKPLDFDRNGSPEHFKYMFHLDEQWTHPGPNSVSLMSLMPINLRLLSLDSGPISRKLDLIETELVQLSLVGADPIIVSPKSAAAWMKWNVVAGATGYDVLSATQPDLSDAQCVATGVETTGLLDTQLVDPASARNYLVRPLTESTPGPWGFDSTGRPRTSGICGGGAEDCERAMGWTRPNPATGSVTFCAPAGQCANDNAAAQGRASDKVCQDQFGATCLSGGCSAPNNCCAFKEVGDPVTLAACVDRGDPSNRCPGTDTVCECTYTVPPDPERRVFVGFRCDCTCQSASCPGP
jgi:hypothetical protein